MDFKVKYNVENLCDYKGLGKFLIFSEKEQMIACPPFWNEKEGKDYLLSEQEMEPILLSQSLVLSPLFTIGERGGVPLYSISVSQEISLPQGWEWVSFYSFYRIQSPLSQSLFSRAKQVLTWNREHQFCGSCGTKTELGDAELCRSCPNCFALHYPRISPAIIVRITRGKQILLAHNVHFEENLYSHIAGFVDVGETLEETVRREVKEEVGLRVENIQYFSSQSWPLPHSMMIAMTAQCHGGEPKPDGIEIEDAQWFNLDKLPGLPPLGSIARVMLDDFIKNNS